MKLKILIMIIIVMIMYIYLPAICRCSDAFVTEASWYSRASCAREETGGPKILMANGKELKDYGAKTCASWDYPFGARLKVSSMDRRRSIVCVVTDRGPAKRLYRMGRRIDLNVEAFDSLACRKQGLIKVRVERVG